MKDEDKNSGESKFNFVFKSESQFEHDCLFIGEYGCVESGLCCNETCD